MGTSVSYASPGTPRWRFSTQHLSNPQVPVERQVQEVWRAAAGDREAALSADLAVRPVVTALRIAATANNPLTALNTFDAEVDPADSASLGVEFARRALARTAAAGGGRPRYVGELFAEATNYYVARDLSSRVGRQGAVQTPSEGLAFKQAMEQTVRVAATATAQAQPLPDGTLADLWPALLASVLARLKGE